MDITSDHLIGEGYGETHAHKNLYLHYVPQTERFMLGFRHKGDEHPIHTRVWGVFAMKEQMEAHYMEHPLTKMGNQTLLYSWPGTEAQPVTVKRHKEPGSKFRSETHLLVAITNPPHLGGPAKGPHLFLVEHQRLQIAVRRIQRSLSGPRLELVHSDRA